MTEEIVKIPKMNQPEYDRLIREEYVARIAFPGEKYPYIAPFIYVFEGNHMYFLSTKYGKKIENFMHNPYVSVEVEKYSPDMSKYAFISNSRFITHYFFLAVLIEISSCIKRTVCKIYA